MEKVNSYNSNNFGKKWDIQQFNQWTVNKKNTLKSAFWYQRAFREIPPTMTQTLTSTWQRDRATRAVVSWESRPQSRSLWQTRAAWLEEGIFFYLSEKTDSSRSRTLLLSSDYSNALTQRFFFQRWFERTTAVGQRRRLQRQYALV